MNKKRNIIVHYHLFKNAGTSIDLMLEDSFGSDWIQYDETTEKHGKMLPSRLIEYILANKNIKAISSHRLVPPIINHEYLNVFPIILIRNPIDRAFSAYQFQVKVQKSFGTLETTFEDYIKHFAKPNLLNKNSIMNYQSIHLSNSSYDLLNIDFENKSNNLKFYEEALKNIESLELIGLVDQYDSYINKFGLKYSRFFPELKITTHHENVTQDKNKTLEEKILNIKNSLTQETYNLLVSNNSEDQKLYNFILNKSQLS